MLIRRAELESGVIADVRIEGGLIVAIGALQSNDSERVIDARGGLLLPGLHDHHIHVAALAASLTSVHCGPPDVADADAFAACLQQPGHDWLRATGYHDSVAGMLDAAMLDCIVRDRPIRIQHRSGRMWFFNSMALERLLATHAAPASLDIATGRLFDDDAWLRQALGSEPPSFAQVGTLLAGCGVTGLTEMSPANDATIARHFARETSTAALPQRVLLAGKLDLTEHDASARVQLGPAKLHLHEAHLPTLEDATQFIRSAHERARNIAIHCATEVELMFALAALTDAGVRDGDRIEHASVAPDHAVATIAQLGLAVVTQPHFIRERGDAYLQDVDAHSHDALYRLRAFLDAEITLAAGSDAPFGSADPWLAIASAVARRTELGKAIGESEALTPEEALDLYLRAPDALDQRRRIEVGVRADLCLLDRPWAQAREALSSLLVRATLIDGWLIFDRVDQSPA